VPDLHAILPIGLIAALLGLGAVAASGNLPGPVGDLLGQEEEAPNPPCRLGLFRRSPDTPPQPAGERWRFEPRAPRAPVEGSATAVGDVVYATNGSAPHDLRRVLAFDTRTRRWSEPTQTPVGLNHTQPVGYRGDLYLAGGFVDGSEPTGRFWRYDVDGDRWTELPQMRHPRGGLGAAVIGDKLYTIGGGPNEFFEGAVEGEGTLEIYDFRAGEWTLGPAMPHRRHHLSAGGVDGKLYAVGGRNRERQAMTVVDRYDPRTGKWETLPRLPIAVSSPGVTSAAGKLVVSGGADETNWQEGGGYVTPSAWAYDPKRERWARLPDHHIERRGHGAATANGRIYSLMGSPCSGLKPTGPVGTRTVESLPVSALRAASPAR
jgi:N-acetylneuraminic acid mutarotase